VNSQEAFQQQRRLVRKESNLPGQDLQMTTMFTAPWIPLVENCTEKSDDASTCVSNESSDYRSESLQNQELNSESKIADKEFDGLRKSSKECEEPCEHEQSRLDASARVNQDIAAKSTSIAIEAFVAWLKASGAMSDAQGLEDLPAEIEDKFTRICCLVATQTSLPAHLVSQCLWETVSRRLRDDVAPMTSRKEQQTKLGLLLNEDDSP